MKQSVKKLFGSVSLLLICLTVSLILIFAGQGAVEDTTIRKKDVAGITVNAVSILDVKGVMKMTAFNYLPNEFAELGETVSDENAGDTPAKRGTYRLYIDTLTSFETGRKLAPHNVHSSRIFRMQRVCTVSESRVRRLDRQIQYRLLYELLISF